MLVADGPGRSPRQQMTMSAAGRPTREWQWSNLLPCAPRDFFQRADDGFGSILLKKSSLLMRLTPSDTADHVDLNRSFRRPSSSHEERILRRNLRPASFCENFVLAVFSTFSTESARSGHSSPTKGCNKAPPAWRHALNFFELTFAFCVRTFRNAVRESPRNLCRPPASLTHRDRRHLSTYFSGRD